MQVLNVCNEWLSSNFCKSRLSHGSPKSSAPAPDLSEQRSVAGPSKALRCLTSAGSNASKKTAPENVQQLLTSLARLEDHREVRTLTGFVIFSLAIKKSTELDCLTTSSSTTEKRPSRSESETESSCLHSGKRRLIIPKESSISDDELTPVSPDSSSEGETPTVLREDSVFTFDLPGSSSDQITPTVIREDDSITFATPAPDSDSDEPVSLDVARDYDTWLNENLMMAAQDTSVARAKISTIKEERYGSAFQIYSGDKITAHLKHFEHGVSYLTTEFHFNKYGRDSVGCPDGSLFVSPIAATASVLKQSDGDVSQIKKMLGLPGWPDDAVIRVVFIENPKEFLITLPSGQEYTANHEFEYGGFAGAAASENRVPEAVLQMKVPKGKYKEYAPAQFLEKVRQLKKMPD